jgi:hypothetical protein
MSMIPTLAPTAGVQATSIQEVTEVFLSQDYRSRAIGLVAAMGVLMTGVAVNGKSTGARARAPAPAVAQKTRPTAARPAIASRLHPPCDPVPTTGTVPVC